jgi:hypothetical protein
MKTEAEKQEAADKPVKLFEVNYTFWDDGEIGCLRREIVKKERGAPEKWLLETADFLASLKASLSEDKFKILEQMAEHIGITYQELKINYSGKAQNVISINAGAKAPTSETKAKADAVAKVEEDDEFNFDKASR